MKALEYRVELGPRSYAIHIEPGCLDKLAAAMERLFPKPGNCLVVTNDTVAPLYLERLRVCLANAGWQVAIHILPDGERFKDIAHWQGILDALMANRLARNEPVIALGGGVVGDIAGFAAACYRRGVPYVQVPTTLLAQVDSSVGGKTAVNHPLGKNMIGAFYQPRLVWIDPRVLFTLPPREMRAGLAEVVKYGLIRDAEFFAWLEAHTEEILALNSELLAELIFRSCRHKAEVVIQDETEQGMRALLNLGHTFGHAIEALTQYRRFLHGEAVAIGTLMAARLSERLGHCPAGTEARIRALYQAIGLPLEAPGFSRRQWLQTMGHDKKNIGRRIRFVLLKDIGSAFVAEDVPDVELAALLSGNT